jgi:hypothetical protein
MREMKMMKEEDESGVDEEDVMNMILTILVRNEDAFYLEKFFHSK